MKDLKKELPATNCQVKFQFIWYTADNAEKKINYNETDPESWVIEAPLLTTNILPRTTFQDLKPLNYCSPNNDDDMMK